MIHVEEITKGYATPVLQEFSLTIKPGAVYGVVGYNGAGKTTLMKTLCGIYRPEKGRITIDEKPVYENEELKKTFFMVQEEALFLPQATLKSMEKFYRGYYPRWSHNTFIRLSEIFGLDIQKRINGFSKGMQRQASIILALSTHPQYLLLDESFDGLDLAKRNLLKKIIFAYMKLIGKNVIISSHNLRELEGLCEHIVMIKDSRLYFENSVDEMHEVRTKLKAEFSEDVTPEIIRQAGGYQVIGEGKTYTFLCDIDIEHIQHKLRESGLIRVDKIPMTLEEVFLEDQGEEEKYDFAEIFQ